MTDVIANVFVQVHPSKAKLTLVLDGNCFIIESRVSVYSLRQRLPSLLADGHTNSSCNELCECRSSRFDIPFHEIWAETNSNMTLRFQVSWWHSAVWKSFAASSERFVCQFSKYTYNLNVEYDFPLRTYTRNTSTSLLVEYGQSCFIDDWTSQFSYFWLC